MNTISGSPSRELSLAGSVSTSEGDALCPERALAVGFHHTVADAYEVGLEKVREYARAVQDGHPVHWDCHAAVTNGHATLVAPLTFMAIPGLNAHRSLFEAMGEGWDLWRMMQTDQRFVFHRPVVAGDRLLTLISLDAYRRVRGADVVVTKCQIHDDHDAPVMTTWTTLVSRADEAPDPSVMVAVDHAMPVADPARYQGCAVADRSEFFGRPDPVVDPRPYGAIDFDTLVVGQTFDPRAVQVTRGNLVNYAGVSGDLNPIHFSDEVARIVGLETVVAHGVQTMGIGAGYISSLVGDPGAVHEYAVRFTSPVYVPADGYGQIDLTAKIKSLDPDTRRGEIALTARSNGRKVFGRAVAGVQFA